jgi:DNA mismatch repair protein MutL
MQDIIQLLPDSLANQIAAGEVVQRPASIVKELLENAIDAQATQIKLIVKDAGKTLVQVIDNGMGMSETDARLSFERHATSKIRTTEDLFSIRTMGFRGEALASIAAVAQVEMKTKRATDELGTFILMEASKVKRQETVTMLSGTSICVKNLFFNVPARRNFLKSNPVEMRHILDEFHRIALAHPDLEFSLISNDTEVYQLPAGKLSNRIVGIFGKNYQKQLATCQEETPLLNVKGYIGKPENAKKTRGEQFFFVNERYIRHAYLHHAVTSAFEDLIPKDAFPFYVLFLELDPIHIDINIHPTKTEVKFDDERAIYAIIQSAVRKALSVHHLAPSLDFETDVNFNALEKPAVTFSENKLYQGTAEKFWKGNQKTAQEKHNLTYWESLYSKLQSNIPEETPTSQGLKLQSRANKLTPDNLFGEEISLTERNILQLHQRYLLTPVRSGLLLIDQQRANERIYYDRYHIQLEQQNGVSQQLLFPARLELNPADYSLLLEIESEIRNLGFVFEHTENNQLLLKGLPTDLAGESERELLDDFLAQVKKQTTELKIHTRQVLARSLAKRTASKVTRYLTVMEMNLMIDQLFASTNPNYTPDGLLIHTIVSLGQIGEFF